MPLLLPLLVTITMAAADGSAAVVHLKSADVDARMAAGTPMLLSTDRYKVMMAERTKGGEVEVHDTDTDVIRVIAGSAVFVTGGRVVDPRTIAPGETRAPTIEGGDERPIAAGDVLVVPAGTPHWFKSVEDVRYFVVKVVK